MLWFAGMWFGNDDKEPSFGQIGLGRMGVPVFAALTQSRFSLMAASLQQEEIFSHTVRPPALRSRGALKEEPGARLEQQRAD